MNRQSLYPRLKNPWLFYSHLNNAVMRDKHISVRYKKKFNFGKEKLDLWNVVSATYWDVIAILVSLYYNLQNDLVLL